MEGGRGIEGGGGQMDGGREGGKTMANNCTLATFRKLLLLLYSSSLQVKTSH